MVVSGVVGWVNPPPPFPAGGGGHTGLMGETRVNPYSSAGGSGTQVSRSCGVVPRAVVPPDRNAPLPLDYSLSVCLWGARTNAAKVSQSVFRLKRGLLEEADVTVMGTLPDSTCTGTFVGRRIFLRVLYCPGPVLGRKCRCRGEPISNLRKSWIPLSKSSARKRARPSGRRKHLDRGISLYPSPPSSLSRARRARSHDQQREASGPWSRSLCLYRAPRARRARSLSTEQR